LRVVWSPLARYQVAQILATIAAERPEAAASWLDNLAERASSLRQFPDLGRAVPETDRPSLRELLVGPYRLIYRRDDNEVFILTLRHVRRDFDAEEPES
jgi:toxin ParE1/3/4